MDKIMHRRMLLFYFLITLAAALILAGARIYMMISFYEPQTDMYVRGTNVPTLFRVLTGLVCVVLASSFFVFRKRWTATPFGASSSLIVFSSSLCCFLMLAYFLVSIYEMYLGNFKALYPFVNPAATSNEVMRALFFCLHLVLLIPAAFYFFRIAAARRNTGNVFCLLSMSAVVFFTVTLISTYLDISLSFNSPTKLLDQLTLIFLIFYLLCETRFNMGIPKAQYYFPIAFITVLLICIYALPNLVLSSFWYLSSDNGTVYDVLLLSFAFYIASRCITFLRLADEYPLPEAHD